MDVKERIIAELTAARDRSFGLTVETLEDPELTSQVSPLMSPLVWDLAHIGNYEEQWLLRAAAGAAAVRPDIDDIYDAFEHPRAERPSLPLLSPKESRALRHDRPRPGDRLAGEGAARRRAGRGRFRLPHGDPARAPARRDDAGHPPAPQGRPRAARPYGGRARRRAPRRERGAHPRRAVRHGHLRRPVGLRQRTARSPRRRAVLLPGHDPGRQRRVRRVRRGGRLPRPAVVASGRLEVAVGRGQGGARVLVPRGRPVDAPPPRPRRAGAHERAGAARQLVRGGRVRAMGGPTAADRGGVGEGRELGSGHRAASAACPGATRARPASTPTSASGGCAPLRSARTPPARRPTGYGS